MKKQRKAKKKKVKPPEKKPRTRGTPGFTFRCDPDLRERMKDRVRAEGFKDESHLAKFAVERYLRGPENYDQKVDRLLDMLSEHLKLSRKELKARGQETLEEDIRKNGFPPKRRRKDPE